MSDKKRINKYLADKGLCSRREAEKLILKGWISLNGEVITELATSVGPQDKVSIAQEARQFLNKKQTLIIHKPLGYVSAQAEDGKTPAIRLVKAENHFGKNPPRVEWQGFAPVGRLDIDSTGLLILTQNGKLAKEVIQPDSDIEKEYVVLVEGEVTSQKLKKLEYGLRLDGKKLKRARVKHEESQKLRFVLKEGKKRQIRRMCELVDLKVTSLKRVRIGKLKLGPLPLGQWRLMKDSDKI